MKTTRISEAEWQIMKIVWRRPGAAAQDIIEALSEVTDWSPATVKTLLNRLVKKKALDFEKRGKSYLYSARIAEEDCRGAAAESFLDRVFNGSLAPMVAHFVKSGALSKKEIEELENLLRKGDDQ
jgi:BlaI family penicillinase repressor